MRPENEKEFIELLKTRVFLDIQSFYEKEYDQKFISQLIESVKAKIDKNIGLLKSWKYGLKRWNELHGGGIPDKYKNRYWMLVCQYRFHPIYRVPTFLFP